MPATATPLFLTTARYYAALRPASPRASLFLASTSENKPHGSRSVAQAAYLDSRFPPDLRRDRAWKSIVRYVAGFYDGARADILDVGAGYCSFINLASGRRRVAVDIHDRLAEYAAAGVEHVVASATDLSVSRQLPSMSSSRPTFLSIFRANLSSRRWPNSEEPDYPAPTPMGPAELACAARTWRMPAPVASHGLPDRGIPRGGRDRTCRVAVEGRHHGSRQRSAQRGSV